MVWTAVHGARDRRVMIVATRNDWVAGVAAWLEPWVHVGGQ